MAGKVQKRVEEQYGKSVAEVLEELKKEGLNKCTAADRLQITKNTLLSWIKKHDIDWPLYTEEAREKRSETLRTKTDYWVTYRRKKMTLSEACRLRGMPYKVVLERYKKGDRGARLWRRIRRYKKTPKVFQIGLSMTELESVVQLAEQIGAKAAAQKYGIPMAAVSAAMRGELERID